MEDNDTLRMGIWETKGGIRMRIICDMDEVLVNFIEPLVKQYNKGLVYDDLEMTVEEITDWELHQDLKDIFLHTEGFFFNLPPLEGAIEGIRKLAEEHDIIIASSPSYTGRIAAEKIDWVKKWLPEMIDNLVLTHNKGVFDAHVMIDDSVRFLEQFYAGRIIMDRPWNRDYNEADVRAYNWDDILWNIGHLRW